MGLDINKIHCGDCAHLLKEIPNKHIDLTVTSPPYNSVRDYKGFEFDFDAISKELYRVTKDGGLVVWVVGDSVKDGGETLTPFRQAIQFKDVGFNIHDTMIYVKSGIPFPESIRYNQSFEYIFVMSKGKPKTFNPIKVNTKYKRNTPARTRQKDGTLETTKYEVGKNVRVKGNVWKYNTGFGRSTSDRIAFEHPAIFPDKLAEDCIKSWSNEEDIVLDPFIGSGTTAVACKKLNRNYIGIEISKDYCETAKNRTKKIVTLRRWL